MRNEITKDRFKSGIIITFTCIIVVLVIIAVVDYKSLNRNTDPEGTGWYRGWITKHYSTNERINTEKNQTVYDCNVTIQYDVDGKTYEKNLNVTNSSVPLLEGDAYYVCCYKDNPENIHSVSKDKKNDSKKFMVIFDIIPIFIFLIIFIWFFKSGMYNSIAKGLPRGNDNCTSFENVNDSSSIANCDENTNKGGSISDYSGTSLRD